MDRVTESFPALTARTRPVRPSLLLLGYVVISLVAMPINLWQ